jgi:hypothetical protein
LLNYSVYVSDNGGPFAPWLSQTAPDYSRADANRDGVVDVRDLAIVAQRLPIGTKCL